ncbi:MAG: S8 family serine peptidase [Candidatus Thioglobus sp.]|nr:S8 family serine peptidase [Candidatus Pseudothioglobus aerophilus]
MLSLLAGCGRGGGSSSAVVSACSGSTGQTVTLAVSDSSIAESSNDSVTLTATASATSCENITVTLSTSGTATNGTDYSSLDGQIITISSGSITGTKTFTTTDDSTYEGDETVIIAISSVSGSSATESGTQSVTLTITEYALRTGTAFTEGSTAEQNTIKNRATWTASEAAGATHAYEQMGLHKVQSFSSGGVSLTGVGEIIHIADFNCDVNHDIYDNKTITNLDDGGSGESTFDSATSSDNHCQGVAMFAAGDVSARSGVAPDADLVLSSIPNFEGSNEGDDYASDLDAARAAGAIVSNQSWGYNSGGTSYNISELESYISSNSLTNAQGLAVLMHGSSSGQALTDSNTYVTALNNFESSGVIVWAAANDVGESDASAMAGLPELFPDLGEAWLVANVVQYTGDSDLSNATSSEFTLKGNKCGSTAEYCLSVDGWDVYAATYVDSGTSQYNASRTSYGSSWSAPMVSGGVALMAQAFPNHTPEQLVDRILASANNVWFTPEGNTTFSTHGNSVKHGYHSTWGHGLPDFYAALSPITSDGNPASMSLYTSNSIQSSAAVTLGSSYITPSASFGNAISQGLIGEVGYAYDALSGGFKYDMSTRVNMTDNKAPTISLSSELSKLDKQLEFGNNSVWKQNFSQVLSTLSKTDTLETNVTLGSSSIPVQSFFGSNSDSEVDLSDYQSPYLESGEGGIGLSANYQLGKSRLLLGATTPILISNLTGGVAGSRKSLIASLEYGDPSETAFTLMTGITQDEDSLLGSTGNDAYSMSGSKSNTTFAAVKAQNKFTNDFTLTGVATAAKTDMSRPAESFINSANNVKSSSVSLVATQKNLTGDDSFSFSISQPNRVNGGAMSIRLSNLAESNGSISYRDNDINLEPTGRQIIYGLSYRKDLDKTIGFSVKHLLTSNLNHNQSSKVARSSYIGLKYKDLKLGFNTNSQDSSRNAELSYKHIF